MSEATIESLAALLRFCEVFAKQMVANGGEFYPFGAFLNNQGGVEALAAHIGVEYPNSQELYQFLHGAISAMAAEKKLIAYAIAANVDIPARFESPFRDGIRVHIEAPGYSRFVYTPYRRLPYGAIRRFFVFPVVEHGETIAADIEGMVFHDDHVDR
jgi:hypothetical protein